MSKGLSASGREKENPPTLYQEVQDRFALARQSHFAEFAAPDWDQWRQISKGHGRLQVRDQGCSRTRQCWPICTKPSPARDWAPTAWWKPTPSLRDGRSELEARCYRLSTRLWAQQFGTAVRSQWGIEQQVHWRLDMAFGEDESRGRVGQAAETFAVLRRLALHRLKPDTTAQCGLKARRLKARRLKARRLKARRLKAGWSQDYLLHILTG